MMNVFDFAFDMEKNAARFYEKLAQAAEKPGLQTIFSKMAEDETGQARQIIALRERTENMMREDSRILDRTPQLFRNSSEQEELLRDIENDLDAYRFVMDMDRQQVRLFEEAAESEPDRDAANLLLQIAREEQRHLEEISNTYDFANAPNEYLAWGEFSNLGEFHNFGRDED